MMKQINRIRKTPFGLKIKKGFMLVFILKLFLFGILSILEIFDISIKINLISIILSDFILFFIAFFLIKKDSEYNDTICLISTKNEVLFYPKSSPGYIIPINKIKNILYEDDGFGRIILSIMTHDALSYDIFIEEEPYDFKNLLDFIEQEIGIMPEKYHYK